MIKDAALRGYHLSAKHKGESQVWRGNNARDCQRIALGWKAGINNSYDLSTQTGSISGLAPPKSPRRLRQTIETVASARLTDDVLPPFNEEETSLEVADIPVAAVIGGGLKKGGDDGNGIKEPEKPKASAGGGFMDKVKGLFSRAAGKTTPRVADVANAAESQRRAAMCQKQLLGALGVNNPEAGEVLAELLKRPGGYAGLTEDEKRRLDEYVGITDADAWDALARQYDQAGKRGADQAAGGAASRALLSEGDRERLAAAGLADRGLQDGLARAFQRAGPGGELSDEDRDALMAAGIGSPSALAALARLFKRGAGGDLSDDAYAAGPASEMGSSGSAGAAASKLFKRGAGGDLSDEDREGLAKIGVTDPAAQVALARLFKRGAGGDLSEDERSALAAADLSDPAAQAAMTRLFQRPGGFADLSADDNAALSGSGLGSTASQQAMARLFKRGNGADLGPEDDEGSRAALLAAGLSDPAKQAALARHFKRGGNFAELASDDKAQLRSLGLHDAQAQASLVRAFKRPDRFGELSEEDARILNAAGLPSGSKEQEAFSRFFKRGAGAGDLSAEETNQLMAAGFNVKNPKVRSYLCQKIEGAKSYPYRYMYKFYM